MKNLNIYTWRELSNMYIDGRPMPDVAFVTQTDAMKLQSMPKEENEGWITDRLPTEEDCAFQELVYDCKGVIVHYDCIAQGEAWKPIPKCEPYVKPKRYTAEWVDRGVSWPCWMIRRADFPFHTFLHSLCDQEKHREAAKRIAAIYEEVMP